MANTKGSPDTGGHASRLLAASALILPSFVALASFILWKTTRSADSTFWSGTALAGLMLFTSAVRMIAQKWSPNRVALFLASAGTAMGIGFAGMMRFHEAWWLMGSFGLLFVAMLVALFTDMDERVKFWGVVAAMLVPAAIICGALHYIFSLAGGAD